MNNNLILMFVAILVMGSGISLAVFMNSLWNDNKLISYIDFDTDTDSDSDIDDSSYDTFSANSPLWAQIKKNNQSLTVA